MAAVAAAAAAVADAAAATATAVANAAVRLWLIQSNWFLHFRCFLVPFRLFLKLLLLFMIDVSLSLSVLVLNGFYSFLLLLLLQNL